MAYVDTPVVKDHTGEGLARSWKIANETKGIVPEQIAGWSTDGQYLGLHVDDHLADICRIPPDQMIMAWDLLHKAGLLDTHISKMEKFAWLEEDNAIIQKCYNRWNFGKAHEELRTAFEELNMDYISLNKFSDTRFANSKALVYDHHFRAVEAIEKNLQEYQTPEMRRIDKKRAEDAASLEGELINGLRLLRMAGSYLFIYTQCIHYE